MARFQKEEKIDPEVTQTPSIDMNVLEIRGRGRKWRVAYPDPSNIPSPIKVFDREGNFKEIVYSQVATNKLYEAHEVCTSENAARELAEFLHPGCEIKVVKTSKSTDNLAKAREAKKRKREQESDDE